MEDVNDENWFLSQAYSSKANKIDALLIDARMNRIFKAAFLAMAESFSPISSKVTKLKTEYAKEVDLFIEFLTWMLSIRIDLPTPGLAIQNLRYVNASVVNKYRMENELPTYINLDFKILGDELSVRQKLLLFVYKSLVPYLLHYYKQHVSDSARTILENLEKMAVFLSFLNLLAFLNNGKYRTLSERLLKVSLCTNEFKTTNAISFQVINQPILFGQVTSLLISLVRMSTLLYFVAGKKMISLVSSWKAGLLKLFSVSVTLNSRELFSLGASTGNSVKLSKGCGDCKRTINEINHPVTADSGQQYCFYCYYKNNYREKVRL